MDQNHQIVMRYRCGVSENAFLSLESFKNLTDELGEFLDFIGSDYLCLIKCCHRNCITDYWCG